MPRETIAISESMNNVGEKWDIPQRMKNLWEKWDIRGVILFSLSLQIILILLAPSRKRTQSSILVWSLWSAYLLADWAANFCVGLISNSQKDDETNSTISFLRAFWAPFLLLHLGGPDTITAFSLEDNELWLRHLLGLVFQVVACAYVFFLTLPDNTLWIPTLLVFLAGIIKYAERTRALYLASMNTFRQTMVRDPDPGPNYAKLMEEYHSRQEASLPTDIDIMSERIPTSRSDVPARDEKYLERTDFEVVRCAYGLFDKVKGLIADMIFSMNDREESRKFFHQISFTDALRVIEIELNFIYDVFYTKVSVVRTKVGYLFRFVSFSSVVAAMVLFTLEDKRGLMKFDIRVTYTLLYGALALDFIAFLMLILSDRTVVSLMQSFMGAYRIFDALIDKIMGRYLSLKKPKWSPCEKQPYTKYERLSTVFAFRRWSGSMSGFNFFIYCLDQCPEDATLNDGVINLVWFKTKKFLKSALDKCAKNFGCKDLLDIWKYRKNNPFFKNLWEFICDELESKSHQAKDLEEAKTICSARGEYVLQCIFKKIHKESINGDLKDNLMKYVDSKKVAFDESLILWHIATHLCYEDEQHCEKRLFSILISDYMLYLLVMQQTLMSSIAGIGLIRFQDTCSEATKFFSTRDKQGEKNEQEACKKLFQVHTNIEPVEVKGDRSKSVLFDACRLAHELKNLPLEFKWKVIAQIWVEILSYAASNCRPSTHVQQVSKGGELLSFIWLLMFHLGLGTQFQIKEGHARAKLIVGKYYEEENK